MKRQFLSVILALFIAVCCLPFPALAAEDTGFSDVKAEDWFASYVEVCVEEGLMRGTGAGNFSPERTLTARECSVLALRLYDMMQGGTGDFAPAPEDFGQISIALEDGLTLSGGIGDGCIVQGLPWMDKAWTWEYIGYPLYHKYLMLDISTPEEAAWVEQIGVYTAVTRATATYGGVGYPGTMRFFTHDGTQGALYFYPDDYDAFTEATEKIRAFSTDPGAWYQDAWYYAYTHHTEDNTDSNYYLMEGLVRGNDNNATRWDFASRLARVAGELPAINDIQTIPENDRQEEETLLPLYNAGILTGVDEYGSFCPEGTLTRAEAAAMLARVLRPELRLAFTPAPLPTEGYTLTYLADDNYLYREMTYPVCLFPDGTMLTLDGRLQPWPADGSVPSFGLYSVGDYCYMAEWDTDKPPYSATKGGLIDRTGAWVVPPLSGRGTTYPIEGGFFTSIYLDEDEVWELLDEQGQFVQELDRVNGSDPRDVYPPRSRQPFRGITPQRVLLQSDRPYYTDSTGRPVSQRFDWASEITEDGQGFVSMDGKIYRIEFQYRIQNT